MANTTTITDFENPVEFADAMQVTSLSYGENLTNKNWKTLTFHLKPADEGLFTLPFIEGLLTGIMVSYWDDKRPTVSATTVRSGCPDITDEAYRIPILQTVTALIPEWADTFDREVRPRVD